MTPPDNELLRQFVTEGSEGAFALLVERHLALVYSAALRQLNGDGGGAEDVAQSVFLDLVRKAQELSNRTNLAGWLYTATRFKATAHQRAEFRRKRHEEEASVMNELLANPELDWERVRSVIDDAMHDLSEADREALLARYFESQPLAAVAIRLGVRENAARMRVERALEKLENSLKRRGIASTSAALAAALGHQAIHAAPVGLAARVTQAAMGLVPPGAPTVAPVVTAGTVIAFLTFMTRTKIKALVGIGLLLLLGTGLVRSQLSSRVKESASANERGTTNSTAEVATPISSNGVIRAPGDSEGHETTNTLRTRQIQLTFLAEDSGKPVPGVQVEMRSYQSGAAAGGTFTAIRNGTCVVEYRTNTVELELTSRVDDFADTHLAWSLKRGESIPDTYTVRLIRPVRIGGMVIDADGQPVANAEVGFNHEDEPGSARRPENHEFGWIAIASDAAGHWEINRIAEEMIHRIYGSATHPEHVGSPMVFLGKDLVAASDARAGKLTFRMGRPVTVTGRVVDEKGSGVSGAKVSVGHVGESGRREGTSDGDGGFAIRGCPPTVSLLSAEAEGYAATTRKVDLKADTGPYKLVLKIGKLLRIHLINRKGQPVAGAQLWLDTFNGGGLNSGDDPQFPIQAEVTLKTDANGDVEWSSAPDTELTFAIQAAGYMGKNSYRVRPDGQIHTATLDPALTIRGTVTDSKTGKAIPKFRIVCGWPQKSGLLTERPFWSPLDRFWLNFSGGSYEHTFEEGVVAGDTNPGYLLKFEAEGYASWVSRTIRADEGDVQIDAQLRPSPSIPITVIGPDGQPAANAQVGLVTAGGAVELSGIVFNPHNLTGATRVTTDAQGMFSLPSDESVEWIVVAHPTGFARAPAGSLTGSGTLSLAPWARLDGNLFRAGQPNPDQSIVLSSPIPPTGPLRLDRQSYLASTDGDGHFIFPLVPPGSWDVSRRVQFNAQGWMEIRMTNLTFGSGQNIAITLNSGGNRVAARLQLPPPPSSGPWQVYGALTIPLIIPAEVQNDPAAMARWQLSPDHARAVGAQRSFPFSRQPDGSYVADEVDGGTYWAEFYAYPPESDSATGSAGAGPTTPQPVFVGRLANVRVPNTPASGEIQIGPVTFVAGSIAPAPSAPAGGK